MATDTALCDNLAQKNVILPQIHTQPVLQVSHAYTFEIPVSLLELEKKLLLLLYSVKALSQHS